MKYLPILFVFNSVLAFSSEQAAGIKVPALKLDKSQSLIVENYLKKISAFDGKEHFKLDLLCLKKKKTSSPLQPSIECNLINID
jgi:hypothetical protein